MPEQTTIGIIGGAGWLGSAITRSVLRAGLVAPENLWISSRSARSGGVDDWPTVTTTTDNEALWAACETVILSVRPEDFDSIQLGPRDRLVISVVTGVRAEQIAARLGSTRVVRSLPNAAAEVGKSFTPWWAAPDVTASDLKHTQAIFAACGTEARIDHEDQIDYFTALTGSGPAFPALLAAALAEDAVSRGIDADLADQAVRQLLAGAAELILASDKTPQAMVDLFTDYAGTTAAGLTAMQGAGFREAVAAGLEAGMRNAVEHAVKHAVKTD